MRRATTSILLKTAASAGISCLILAMMFRLLLDGTPSQERPEFLAVFLASFSGLIGLYILCVLTQALVRAVRYRLLIAADMHGAAPGLGHMYVVTLVRNMLVDLLPARIGELSYIGMLNRGYAVPGETCVSSLAISFVFDFIALLFIMAGIVCHQLLVSSPPGWLLSASGALLVIGILLVLCLFVGLRWATDLMGRWLPRALAGLKPVRALLAFMDGAARSVAASRKAGILTRVVVLSGAVRFTKYLGLYLLFRTVTGPSFAGLAQAPVPEVLIAMVSGEATASLPLPSFMSFGTYEAGGALALTLLGAGKAASLMVMLTIHVWSQLIDYALGGLGTVLLLFVAPRTRAEPRRARPTGKRLILAVAALGVLVAGVGWVGLEYRKSKKLGALVPPPCGEPASRDQAQQAALRHALGETGGFIVWSSNRYGNHDILMLSLPELTISRLTRHPHVDYFPRISPDGKQVVFSRSRQTWLSQRSYGPWDVMLVDLETGEERQVAADGNTPTWSEDGRNVRFQRNGNLFVEHCLADGKETVLFRTGTNGVPASVMLETPSYHARGGAMAVTMRKGRRGTALFVDDGAVRRVAGGCELTWAPDGSYLFYVDKGGRQLNQFYKVNPDTLERDAWLDLPGAFSHEYFPKVSNDGQYLVLGASTGGHEHDSADYEIFLWRIGAPPESAVRVTFHTGNDCWPDLHVQ